MIEVYEAFYKKSNVGYSWLADKDIAFTFYSA